MNAAISGGGAGSGSGKEFSDVVADLIDSWVDSGEPSLLTSPMMEFLEKPTLKNAKHVLRSLGIPIPLKTTINGVRGVRRGDAQVGGTGSYVKDLFAIDTLHDLIDAGDVVGMYKLIIPIPIHFGTHFCLVVHFVFSVYIRL